MTGAESLIGIEEVEAGRGGSGRAPFDDGGDNLAGLKLVHTTGHDKHFQLFGRRGVDVEFGRFGDHFDNRDP